MAILALGLHTALRAPGSPERQRGVWRRGCDDPDPLARARGFLVAVAKLLRPPLQQAPSASEGFGPVAVLCRFLGRG